MGNRELDTVRKSFAVELRLLIPQALDAYVRLQNLGGKPDGPITDDLARRRLSHRRFGGPQPVPPMRRQVAATLGRVGPTA
jgi:hypothetical protein